MPDNKAHRKEAENMEFYRKVLTPGTQEAKDVNNVEFRSKWQEDMKSLGRATSNGIVVKQNVPWSAEFDPKFQDREDVSGLVKSERYIAGSGLEVSPRFMIDVASGRSLSDLGRHRIAATTWTWRKNKPGILVPRLGMR